jgi:hypothetical protein
MTKKKTLIKKKKPIVLLPKLTRAWFSRYKLTTRNAAEILASIRISDK